MAKSISAMEKSIEICDSLIAQIEEYRVEMKQIQESVDKNREYDPFNSGYKHGIQEGLKEAIEVIRKFQSGQYRAITNVLVKKAKKWTL